MTTIPIEEAVRSLHPPRVGRLSGSRHGLHHLDVSSHHVAAEGTGVGVGVGAGGSHAGSGTSSGGGNGGSSGGGSSSGYGGGRRRFSPLLLEHGERQLQDWAVLAASAPRQLPGGGGGGGGRKHHKNRHNRRGHRHGSKSKRRRHGHGSDGEERIPSVGMVAVPGRLRLCSRSVVFEPDDTSRGIVRCPFGKMAGRPKRAAASAAANDPAGAVAFVCGRHSVMRADAAVGPHDTVDRGAEFRFTFRHSSPDQFLDLVAAMAGDAGGDGGNDYRDNAAIGHGHGHGHSHGAGFVPSPAAIDRILQPMLDVPFDPHNLRDVREVPRTSNLRCHRLSPLQSQPGCSVVTDRHVYFQPASTVLSGVAEPARAYALRDVVATARRYHGLRDCAVELYLSSGASVLLAYETRRERERVLSLLVTSVPCHTDPSFLAAALEGWKAGTISNFDYLLVLNSASGRTFHDLSRYPVFPWVVADYTSEELDLDSAQTFRDLTKPVGALNAERLEYFMSRYRSMQGDMDHAFLYGTHYSAPGYVLYYLVRSMPEQMLCLQNGKPCCLRY